MPIGQDETRTLGMSASSVIVLLDGMMEFDSASIDPRKMAFERKFADGDAVPMLLDWSSWQENLFLSICTKLWTLDLRCLPFLIVL